MSRIQTVDHAEGAVARLFGLATVTVTTASAAGALEIAGLDRARAVALVDELTRMADSGPGRRDVSDRAVADRRVAAARPADAAGHPVRELARFLPVLLGLFVAGTASGGRRVVEPRGADPRRARRAPLPDHVVPDRRRPHRAAPRPAQPARALHPAGPGPHCRHHLLPRPPAARADRGAHRHRAPRRPTRTTSSTSTACRSPRPAACAPSCLDADRSPHPAPLVTDARTVLEPRSGVGRGSRRSPAPGSPWPAPCSAVGSASRSTSLGVGANVDADRIARDAEGWSLWVVVPGAARRAGRRRLACSSIAGYVVTNWGFPLTHARGAWHLRRGLLTTRETTLDDGRLSRRLGRRADRPAAGRRRPRLRDRHRARPAASRAARCSCRRLRVPVVRACGRRGARAPPARWTRRSSTTARPHGGVATPAPCPGPRGHWSSRCCW